MKRLVFALLALLAVAPPAVPQTPFVGLVFPPTTVMGNPTSQSAFGQAIPFSVLQQQLLTGPGIAQLKSLLTTEISITDPAFGAVCNGSNDDTSAIQAAINSLPNDGGIILFPVTTCKISSTLTIGNGTASAVSTKRGVILRGRSVPGAQGTPFFGGYPAVVGPRLLWAGGSSSSMVSIVGPLKGWGIQNLAFDCASTSGMTGISVTSAGYGDSSNLFVRNCPGSGISSNAFPLGGFSGVGNVDAIRNNWTTIDVVVPAVVGAKGILLNGDSGGTSNTDYNTWTNVFIRLDGNANPNYGLYLAVTDSNVFNSINISGGGVNSVNVAFDYSINNQFPNGNIIVGIDSNGTGTQWQNIGSPGNQIVNYAYGIAQSNGGTMPNLTNLSTFFGGTWSTFTPAATCGTATFTTNSAKWMAAGRTVSFEFDLTITVIGTCSGNTINFTLPRTAASAGSANGRETAVTGFAFTCSIASASATAQCSRFDGSLTWAVNNRIVASGVFESQ